jgi:4-hydroxy-tetrahydrodipicolinate synthase
VADGVKLPVVLYNIPGRSAANLEPATVLRLIEAAPNIEAVKESSGNLVQITELITQAPKGFQVYSGDDGMTLGVLGVGGAGAGFRRVEHYSGGDGGDGEGGAGE